MSSTDNNGLPRRRSVTSVALGWLAERMRRTEKIKEQIQSGTYQVDPQRVASAILEPKKEGTA